VMKECCGNCIFMAECSWGKYLHKNNGYEACWCVDFAPDEEEALAESRAFLD